MKKIVLKLIKVYQNFISPYKGFSCAYRVSTGEMGCSGYGYKVISKYGVIKGFKLLNRRFVDCSFHSKKLKEKKIEQNKNDGVYLGALKGQRGFIDIDCGGCDGCGEVGSCDMPDMSCSYCGSCDVFDALECGEFFGSEESKEKRNIINEKKYTQLDKKKDQKNQDTDDSSFNYDDSDGED